MTTIVIDFKEQSVYADKCTTYTHSTCLDKNLTGILFSSESERSDMKVARRETDKLYVSGNKVITGCGDTDLIRKFQRHYDSDKTTPILADEYAIIYVIEKRPQGLVVDTYKPVDGPRKWYLKRQKVWQITSEVRTEGYITKGSGGDYAMGALLAGVSPQDAIRLASTVDPYTGFGVDCVDLNELEGAK